LKLESVKSTANISSNNYNADDSKYAIWTLPENQNGDGKNLLNRKYMVTEILVYFRMIVIVNFFPKLLFLKIIG
jgi:hypothetical protein